MSEYNGDRFFSFSNAGGFDWHATLQAAKDAAEMALDCEREDSTDGWDEDDVCSICYGEIKGTTVETARMSWNDHERQQGTAEEDLSKNPQFDEFVDFDMEHFA